jgi:hypothetical protein
MDADASEYERNRLENIRRNQELFKSLQLDAVSAAFRSASAPKPRVPRVPRAKREKKDKNESSTPRRTSSRLAGIPADAGAGGNAVVGSKRKSDGWSFDKVEEAERAKRQRVAGDLSFEIKRGLFADKKGWDTETFTKDDVDRTADGGLKEVRERMMGLKLWEKFEPNGSSSNPRPPLLAHTCMRGGG